MYESNTFGWNVDVLNVFYIERFTTETFHDYERFMRD